MDNEFYDVNSSWESAGEPKRQRFPFVKEGLNSIAIAELLRLIAVGVAAPLAAILLKSEERSFILVFLIAIGVLAAIIISLVFTIKGLSTASHEREEFQKLLTIYIIALVLNFGSNSVEDSLVLSLLIDLAKVIFDMMYILKLLSSVAEVLSLAGQYEESTKVSYFRKLVIVFYILSFVLSSFLVVALIEENLSVYNAVIIILAIISVVIAIGTYKSLRGAADAL